jgi:PAB-dependent poly(A)-specific ribonuclease subunit 3
MYKAGLYVSEQLRADLQQRSFLVAAQVDPEGEAGVPQVLGSYHTLYPLEELAAAAEASSQALGVTTQVAKAISSVDGQAYALRRVDGRQVIPTAELLGAAEAAVARWEACAHHPGLAVPRDALVSEEWDGTPSLLMAHDYHPGAFTLEQAHILPAHTAQGLVRNPASEEQLWSYLVQLASALRCVHSAGLAARAACLMPSKVRRRPRC